MIVNGCQRGSWADPTIRNTDLLVGRGYRSRSNRLSDSVDCRNSSPHCYTSGFVTHAGSPSRQASGAHGRVNRLGSRFLGATWVVRRNSSPPAAVHSAGSGFLFNRLQCPIREATQNPQALPFGSDLLFAWARALRL